MDLPGLHNVIYVSDKLYSGSDPEGDAGFASLKQLGVKTILSVDGARPEVMRAKKFGMRYVHEPIGYDRVSQVQALTLAKAARDLPGPIYVHCHHGKHRSPAAAAGSLQGSDRRPTWRRFCVSKRGRRLMDPLLRKHSCPRAEFAQSVMQSTGMCLR